VCGWWNNDAVCFVGFWGVGGGGGGSTYFGHHLNELLEVEN